MKVDVKKIDATTRELKFEVPKERVSKKLDQVYQDIAKEAKIKGFRPGKAPRHVIEAHHGRLAHDETIKQIIPEVYQEAIAQEKLEPIDMPEIQDVDFKDGAVSFTARLEIRPEVKVKDYKGVKVKRKSSEATDEEINKTLELFKQGQKKDKQFILDDAFARELGFPNLEDFKSSLRRQLEIDKDRQNRIDVENQIVEQILKNAQLTVPSSAVKKQVEHRIRDIRHRMEHQGMKKEDIDKRIEEMQKELKEVSERDLRVYFVFEKIAELEQITVEEGENMVSKVLAFLLKEAQWEGGK